MQLGVTSIVLTFEEASFGTRGYLAVSSENIAEQEGEPVVDDSRF
jgi:hypothetical protein